MLFIHFQSSTDYKPIEIDQSVQQQELQMKIKENEILHEQLHDVSQQHQIIVRKLEERLEVLERESKNYDKTIEETNARFNRIIERLQEDRTVLQVLCCNFLQLGSTSTFFINCN